MLWRAWGKALKCLRLYCLLPDKILAFRMSWSAIAEVLPTAFIKIV